MRTHELIVSANLKMGSFLTTCKKALQPPVPCNGAEVCNMNIANATTTQQVATITPTRKSTREADAAIVKSHNRRIAVRRKRQLLQIHRDDRTQMVINQDHCRERR